LTVRIDGELSESFRVENGTPQRSIVSPFLFVIMIDQIFKDLQGLDGVALFVDDGAMWKMGRTIEFIVSKMQDTVYKVQQSGVKWGFRISIEKTKVVFFTRTEISQELKIMNWRGLKCLNIWESGIWEWKVTNWPMNMQREQWGKLI